MVEGLDILVLVQDLLLKLLVLRLGFFSACDGVVGLRTELSQSLINRRVRTTSRLRWCVGAHTSLILSMG